MPSETDDPAAIPPTRLPGAAILQVTPELDAGGVEQTTLDVAEAIVAAGGRALVASAGGRLEGELEQRGGMLIRLPVQSKNPATMIANALALRRLITREGIDLVHVRSRAPAFAAFWAARSLGVPALATYHGVYNARSGLKRWYNRVMTRGALTIANSRFTRAHVLAEHHVEPDRVIAIPRGIDLCAFDPAAVSAERVRAARAAFGVGKGEPRMVALLAGRLTRWKGQALAIEALRRMQVMSGREEILLVLAGDDQGRTGYADELRLRAASAGLEHSVRLCGHIADMPAAYLAADIALAPSLEPEAFGRTAVEPQAMGRPVLAADHGGATETVEDGATGWLIPPGDADAWASALRAAIDAGPDARARMGRAGMARARALYGLARMTDLTLAVYARLLADRGVRRPSSLRP